ncbi:MAG TPA: LITAF-like zinc ribbon domain-containing protein [Pyrinomonadaceae bacterium]
MNDDAVRVCRYCGSGLSSGWQPTPQRGYAAPQPPPPYSWANSNPPAPLPVPVPPPVQAPPMYQPPTSGYRCPRCGTNYLPIVESKISQDGWVVFALLLFFCFPLFWIGLLMKQETRICPMCRAML